MVKVRVGHNSNFREFSDIAASKRGYKFQFDLTRRILQRLSKFSSVTTKDGRGNLMTLDNFEKMGPDGGIDMIIEIETKTELSCKQIAGKVKKVLLEKV